MVCCRLTLCCRLLNALPMLPCILKPAHLQKVPNQKKETKQIAHRSPTRVEDCVVEAPPDARQHLEEEVVAERADAERRDARRAGPRGLDGGLHALADLALVVDRAVRDQEQVRYGVGDGVQQLHGLHRGGKI
jgi:hypothetical protein